MFLALYTGCIVVLVAWFLYMVISPIVRGSPQVILCTECQQGKAACPLLLKGCNPTDIMIAAKSGQGAEALQKGASLCSACGKCQKACPRGLAPYLEVEKWRQSMEKQGVPVCEKFLA